MPVVYRNDFVKGAALLLLASSPWIAAKTFAQSPDALRVDQGRIERRIHELGRFGANPEGGVSRVAYSQADLDGRAYVMSLMKEAGLQVRVDEAANIIGRKEGSQTAPAIVFGSHVDSVPHGGNYDGDVGVIGAIEVAQVLHENGYATRHPIEVVVFSNEEGGLFGSRGMIGDLDEAALRLTSQVGMTVGEGIRVLGGDPDRLADARRQPEEILAFVELHIEQGGILDQKKIDIGVVEGIVGISWWEVVIDGFANHAGTTPMDQRRDAMLSAARLVVAVNEVATSIPGRQVATVGRIRVEPGAPNVIPGRVVMSLEIRDLSSDKIEQVFAKIEERAGEIADRAGTPITFKPTEVSVPAKTDDRIRAIIADAAADLKLASQAMPSGAGHDAQDMARIAPVGMIFVPSVKGISHSPKEFTSAKAMAAGANVLLRTVLRIDAGALDTKP